MIKSKPSVTGLFSIWCIIILAVQVACIPLFNNNIEQSTSYMLVIVAAYLGGLQESLHYDVAKHRSKPMCWTRVVVAVIASVLIGFNNHVFDIGELSSGWLVAYVIILIIMAAIYTGATVLLSAVLVYAARNLCSDIRGYLDEDKKQDESDHDIC